MKMNPLISVIMPVYNSEKYLNEAIESILNQTFSNFEFIIINDGSTDQSLEIIYQYKNQDDRIVLINRENRGLINSLNEGIEKATGKYIARMDADDISLPLRFEKQIELMENKKADICGCHYHLINEEGRYIDNHIVPLSQNSFLYYLCLTPPFAHPSVMIRKDFFDQKQLTYGNTSYLAAEDYALWIELWQNNAKFENVDTFLFLYREINNSLSKRNLINIKNDTFNINKQFIANTKNILLEVLCKENINNLPRKEQELLVLILLHLVRYHHSIKALAKLLNINKRVLICGFLKFLFT